MGVMSRRRISEDNARRKAEAEEKIAAQKAAAGADAAKKASKPAPKESKDAK